MIKQINIQLYESNFNIHGTKFHHFAEILFLFKLIWSDNMTYWG